MIQISVTERPLFERLKLFKNPRLMRRFANNIRGYSRSNITRQRSVDSHRWAPRKSGTGKMYLGMRKLIQVRDVTPFSAVITLGKGGYGIHAAQLANAMHNAKGPTPPPPPPLHTYWGRFSESEQAEWRKLSAAERLYRYGYERRTKNGYVRASQRYLNEMSDKQQGFLLRKLGLSESDYHRKRKQWEKRSLLHRMEKRPFMGATPKQQQQALARAIQSLQYGRK